MPLLIPLSDEPEENVKKTFKCASHSELCMKYPDLPRSTVHFPTASLAFLVHIRVLCGVLLIAFFYHGALQATGRLHCIGLHCIGDAFGLSVDSLPGDVFHVLSACMVAEILSRDRLVGCRMVADQDILESGDLVVVVSDIVASDNKVRSVQLRHVA